MKPEFYHVPLAASGHLYIMPKPRGQDWLEDEISGFKFYGIDLIVSLITLEEKLETGLADEEVICENQRLQFINFPIKDRSVPDSPKKTTALISLLTEKLKNGAGVAIHCRFGVGRTGLIAAGVLMQFGFTAEKAFTYLSSIRKIKMPDTLEQEAWVKTHF